MKDDIEEIGSREFQIVYQQLREPVKVVAKNAKIRRVIGYFFPGAVDPRKPQEQREPKDD